MKIRRSMIVVREIDRRRAMVWGARMDDEHRASCINFYQSC